MPCTDYIQPCQRELGQVAHVQAGYLSRSRVEASARGTHRLLQARDISTGKGVAAQTAVLFDPERNPDLYRVSKGDILVLARGQSHEAHLVETDLADTLASSVFHIVRPQREVILPGYLVWWLNQSDVQAHIKAGSRGTGIGYVSRQHIEQIPVTLPPRDVQQCIADAMALWRRKQSLQSQLDEKREKLIHAACRHALRQNKE